MCLRFVDSTGRLDGTDSNGNVVAAYDDMENLEISTDSTRY